MFKFAWGWFNIFTLMFWRQLLFGRTRIALYLDNGRVLRVTVSGFNLKGSDWSLDGMRETNWLRSGDNVIAFREIRWFW